MSTPKTPLPSLAQSSGIATAMLAALLFGASTPLAKLLLAETSPWMLAALLYLGSGLGLGTWLGARRLRHPDSPRARLQRGEWPWLAGAILAGGVAAPVLLMSGLSAMPATGASLLLNAEGVFTALLAWFVFRENVDRRIALGMLAIVAGGLVLSWPQDGAHLHWSALWPVIAVLGACLGWGLDNNLTRKVALADAGFIAMTKGLSAGATNLLLALFLGARLPQPDVAAMAAALGFASYGVSLALFVVALRQLGTARTGAYFSVAPFFGALLAVLLLGEPLTIPLLLAGLLMALGVWLHVSERHAHLHTHRPLTHDHSHVHGGPRDDGHHDHVHEPALPPGTRHSHPHAHAPVTHSHAHFPDVHHRHRHG